MYTSGVSIINAVVNSKESTKIPEYIINAVVPLGFNPANLGQLIPALASGQAQAALAVPGATPEIVGAGFQALSQAFAE